MLAENLKQIATRLRTRHDMVLRNEKSRANNDACDEKSRGGQMRGRCYCTKVQFEVTPPTRMFSHCHCESCRRSHGAAFVSWTSVPDSQFKLTQGAEYVAGYESSPEIVWKFCKNCGTPLFQTTRHSPGITYITAASMIDPLDRTAEGHFSYEERVDWYHTEDKLPKYAGKTSDLIRQQDEIRK